MAGFRNSLWWGPPQNFSDRKNQRKISWLELFYDLVYVAAIGQLTHRIASHPTWQVLAYSFLLFCLVFWSWVNGSQYYDLHGSDGIRTRLLTFWQMLAVAAVAITIPDAFDGNHRAFAVAFTMIECLIIYLWWSVGLYDPDHRRFNIFYTINYSIAAVLLIVSVFTGFQVAICLWCLALLFNIAPPLVGWRTVVNTLKERGQIFSASEAIVERFGLFTIIVLTESILSTVAGIADIKDKQPAAWAAFILAILIAFLLWSIYFDMTSEQETKKGYGYMQALIFLHFPLLASLSALGACLKVLITQIDSGLPVMVQWIFCSALCCILFSIVGIAAIMEEDEEARSFIKPVSRLLIGIGGMILIIPVLGAYLNTITFMGIIALLLFMPVFKGTKYWVKYKFMMQKQE